MRKETHIRKVLNELYWSGHDDGRICGRSEAKHLSQVSDSNWLDRRTALINRAMKRLGLKREP